MDLFFILIFILFFFNSKPVVTFLPRPHPKTLLVILFPLDQRTLEVTWPLSQRFKRLTVMVMANKRSTEFTKKKRLNVPLIIDFISPCIISVSLWYHWYVKTFADSVCTVLAGETTAACNDQRKLLFWLTVPNYAISIFCIVNFFLSGVPLRDSWNKEWFTYLQR